MAQTLIRGSTQIVAASITATQIANNTITATQIANATITSTQISASAGITGSQLSSSAAISVGQLANTYIQANGTIAFTAAQSHGGFAITNVASPTNASDVAVKSYVDAAINGIKLKFARVMTIANSALSGFLVIDGYTTVAGDIVFATGQTTASQNGLWTVASGAWTRPAAYASGAVITEGLLVIIDADGTTYKNTKWFNTNTTSITVDTTATTWVQDSTGASYTAGNGLSLAGSAFSITPGTAAQINVTNAGATATAMVSVSGDVTLAATGVATVNNTAGSGFLKYGNIISLEVVGGTLNGTNTSFTIANTPQGSIRLFWDGVLMNPGTGNDYTISGTAITTLFTPSSGDVLLASYIK